MAVWLHGERPRDILGAAHMKIARNDQHARRIKPRRLGKLRRKQQIFPCVGGLVLLDDPGRVHAVLDQVPGHDGRFRIRLVRPLAAGDDHGPVRVLLHEFERFIQPLF